MIANERISKHFEFTINRPFSRSPLPKGKYYYDLSDGATVEIVASTGTRYCLCEKVDEESGAELMDLSLNTTWPVAAMM